MRTNPNTRKPKHTNTRQWRLCDHAKRGFGIIFGMSECLVTLDGALPRALGITRAELKSAARRFAARSSARIRVPFREVAVVLQDDAASAEVHLAVNGAEGPTDVVTQGYDPMPGDEPGVYGELYVNADQALRAAPRRTDWSPAKELLLYVAHGMDHLSGADDLTPGDYSRMRRRELGWIADLQRRRIARTTTSSSVEKSHFASGAAPSPKRRTAPGTNSLPKASNADLNTSFDM